MRQEFRVCGEQLELVARVNGRITEVLVAVWVDKYVVELRHIAVKTDAWKQGIGRELVAALVEIVITRGCCRIRTIARNTSAGFFKKLGFRTVPVAVLEHSAFKKHGIVFEMM